MQPGNDEGEEAEKQQAGPVSASVAPALVTPQAHSLAQHGRA